MPPDYDSDPQRWQSWQAPQDVHDVIAPELHGPVLDAGCGEGRLASLLGEDVTWVGLDSSPTQLASSPYRPVVLADMRALPFRDGTFAEVTHLWCLYHVDDPQTAIGEAMRVLQPGGRYYACTGARDDDPELMPEGHRGRRSTPRRRWRSWRRSSVRRNPSAGTRRSTRCRHGRR